ncbi:MAG: CDP-alcohol phosphatidyltransferase family protein [Anaerolineales bacterium]|nr:CDP-alcohol phosphatidyltransferase family protein [Anaerolineales bacterium]
MQRLTEQPQPLTLTDQLRVRLKGWIDPFGAFFNRLGIHPNTMTILGLAGNIIGAIFLSQGRMTIGGLFVLAMGPVDALDGTMARLRGEPTAFGAFVDSVTDRYSELVIFGGLLYYFMRQSDWLSAMAVFGAASGSVLVSYIRARAASLGYDTKIGILSRFERFAVLVPCLLFNIPHIAVWIIAVLANFTALQRIWDVRRRARKDMAGR